ncbi:hypothetical protein JTB14_035200 [Gonioctena quinquepunctata]|nr:hypothetical protein JTB14_035200 [Gonioctena quinquepunctata]
MIGSTINIKVVLNRIPLGDLTNNLPMSRKTKCVPKDMKDKPGKCPNLVHTPKQGEIFDNTNRCSNTLKNKKLYVFVKSAKSPTHLVPRIHTDCKVILNRINVGQRAQKIQSVNNEKEPKRSSTPLVNRLRKCGEKNYHESTFESSVAHIPSPVVGNRSVLAPQKKILIYQRNVVDEKAANGKDPYELDISDSDKVQPSKKQRNLNISRKYDRTMYDLLEKLEKKEKKAVNKKTVQKYDEKVKNVLKKVMCKVNSRKKPVLDVKVNGSKEFFDKLRQQKNVEGFFGFENGNKPPEKVPILDDCLGISRTASTHKNMERTSVTTGTANRTKDRTFIENINGYESEKGFLGFNNKPASATSNVSQRNERINVISNVTLHSAGHSPPQDHSDYYENEPSIDSFYGFDEEDDIVHSPRTFFTHRRPNANSTMIGTSTESPWRLSLAGKRNRHFLVVKNNSLPSLHQDMVIDHSMIEDVEERNKSKYLEIETSRPKSPVQTSILEYVEGHSELHINPNQENIRRSSLFDYDEFVVPRPKRTILGVLQENELASPRKRQITSTPSNAIQRQIVPPDISAIGDENTLYGFDRTDDECRENQKPDIGKPFRVNVRDIRRYKNILGTENVAELPVTEKSIVEHGETQEKNNETIRDVHLFEDSDPTEGMEMTIKLPSIKYERKRRRKRLLSDDCVAYEEDKPKKKKKDMMTKAELDAFEKWAQEFNSMCKEVDEYDLEIE